ncbi:MAG: HEAT repeat domain-containing protein, partial [Kiritimatiellae bacterium]|nr:HEAT repeat domain-containing protein [Kiritimatiellia bacterium]
DVYKRQPSDCVVEEIGFSTVVQQNYFALPQLQPGHNLITVRGDLSEGCALRVTYVWDDPTGSGRKNVTVIEKTPFTYEIVAGGQKWEDCVCREIAIEAVPSTGQGNRTVLKEVPAPFERMPPMRSAEETRQRHYWHRPDRKDLPSLEVLLTQIAEPGRGPVAEMNLAVRGLMELRAPEAFDALKEVVYEEQRKDGPKIAALVALYVTDKERARRVCWHLLEDIGNAKWRDDEPANPAYREGHWCTAAAVIAQFAAAAGWKEFVPVLVRALKNPHASDMVRWGLLDGLGRLGDGQAAEAVRCFLNSEDLDTVQVAALAAGRLSDRAAIPRLRELLDCRYPPAQFNAAMALAMLHDVDSAATIRKWLTMAEDENYRGIGAEVLGILQDVHALPALHMAIAVEPFPWVRARMQTAIDILERL